MSGLPPALAPWAAQLSGIAPDLAVSLGAWARRIAAAIGALGSARSGPGEPDGLSGIARRGPYERLLVSEWLLAEALPHEFVRRAAMGEQLFLERGVRATHASRRSVALLDTGPDQLGTPRIAQLALLVVLAARADSAGVAFAWGIAQDPAGGLVDGFGEAQARRFLAARSPRPPEAEALRAWSDALPPPQARDDRWLLGGPGLLALAPPGAACVSIRDVPDPVVREVRLELRRGGARAELTLPLPARADCTRLLRDPFHVGAAAPTAAKGRIVPEAGVLWARSGRRIAVRLEDGAVLDAHVPGSPRERPGAARRHRAEGLVGFGWGRKRQVMLATRHEDELRLEFGHRGTGAVATAEDDVALPTVASPGQPLAACHAWPVARQQVLVHHPCGDLYVVKTGTASPRVAVAATVVAAVPGAGSRLVCVASAGPELELLVLEAGRPGRRVRKAGGGTGRAFLSAPFGRAVTAHEERAGSWTGHVLVGVDSFSDPLSLHAEVSLRPPAGTTVVGTTLGHAGGPALLLLEDDRRDFTLLDERGSRLVHGAGEEVVSAAVSPAHRAFAYTTRAGGLVVYSLDREAVLLRLVPVEDAPPRPEAERPGA